jgi:hypothetical protein
MDQDGENVEADDEADGSKERKTPRARKASTTKANSKPVKRVVKRTSTRRTSKEAELSTRTPRAKKSSQ